MHNLLLRTARHIFRLWTELGVLSTQKLEEIQTRIDSLKVPQKIASDRCTDRLEVADGYLQTFVPKFVSLYGTL